MSARTYDDKPAWLELHTALVEGLPRAVDVDMRISASLGINMAVRRCAGACDGISLHIFSGPAVGADWETLVVVDIIGAVGRYRDIHSVVKVADRWMRGVRIKRQKP